MYQIEFHSIQLSLTRLVQFDTSILLCKPLLPGENSGHLTPMARNTRPSAERPTVSGAGNMTLHPGFLGGMNNNNNHNNHTYNISLGLNTFNCARSLSGPCFRSQ